jgi:hypothetical protein
MKCTMRCDAVDAVEWFIGVARDVQAIWQLPQAYWSGGGMRVLALYSIGPCFFCHMMCTGAMLAVVCFMGW